MLKWQMQKTTQEMQVMLKVDKIQLNNRIMIIMVREIMTGMIMQEQEVVAHP